MEETEQSPNLKIGDRMRITGYRILHSYDPAHSARMVQIIKLYGVYQQPLGITKAWWIQ